MADFELKDLRHESLVDPMFGCPLRDAETRGDARSR